MKKLDYDKLAFEFQTTDISLTEMAKREQIDRRTLSRNFKKLGIEIINKWNRPKFNEHIFDSIDTEEKAYWLGFIFADGYIGSTPLEPNKKSVYNFELSLKLEDTSHLEKFRSFISLEKEVVTDDHRCRIMLANKHFWTTLNDYGCVPRKSLVLRFPRKEIFKNESLLRHFTRGYFDGDGCFSRNICTHVVSPVIELLGTREFLEEVLITSSIPAKYTHDKRHSDNTFSLSYSKDDGVLFINYLYDNASVYLDRKYKLFEFFKNGSRSVKEFAELLSDNIGEASGMGNTEINSEIKESESSYSVEVETI